MPEGGGMAVRDTKEHEGPVLRFGAAQWQAFTASLRTASLR